MLRFVLWRFQFYDCVLIVGIKKQEGTKQEFFCSISLTDVVTGRKWRVWKLHGRHHGKLRTSHARMGLFWHQKVFVRRSWNDAQASFWIVRCRDEWLVWSEGSDLYLSENSLVLSLMSTYCRYDSYYYSSIEEIPLRAKLWLWHKVRTNIVEGIGVFPKNLGACPKTDRASSRWKNALFSGNI